MHMNACIFAVEVHLLLLLLNTIHFFSPVFIFIFWYIMYTCRY
jgi:hypothetical protein